MSKHAKFGLYQVHGFSIKVLNQKSVSLRPGLPYNLLENSVIQTDRWTTKVTERGTPTITWEACYIIDNIHNTSNFQNVFDFF